jgi:hypothetical protein
MFPGYTSGFLSFELSSISKDPYMYFNMGVKTVGHPSWLQNKGLQAQGIKRKTKKTNLKSFGQRWFF